MSSDMLEGKRKVMSYSNQKKFSYHSHYVRGRGGAFVPDLRDGLVICDNDDPMACPVGSPCAGCCHKGESFLKINVFFLKLSRPFGLYPFITVHCP